MIERQKFTTDAVVDTEAMCSALRVALSAPRWTFD